MGLLSSLFGWLGSSSNVDAIRDTNRTNLQIARETNKTNVEQANLAYMRSLPVQQVSQLRAAGMSKAAAINALSGGGVYSPPAAVGATMQAPTQDYSFLHGLDESLMGIPSNVQQFKIAAETLNGLKIDNDNKRKAEKRAQELHEFNVWKEQYGKDSATKLDTAKQLIMNALLDQNKDVSNYKTFGSLIKDLGLSNAKELRSLPSIAWSQIESSIRDGFADARSERDQQNRDREQINKNKEQQNRNVAANDAHKKAVAELEDYNKAKDAREKEYHAREIRALLDEEVASIGIGNAEFNAFLNALVKDEDGVYHKDEVAKQLNLLPETFDKIWNAVFKIVPINALSKSILGDLIKIGI